ncbi:hypothetical protein EMIHUDRAFT_74493, partial [Emiliania huxleyi CCMP1516]
LRRADLSSVDLSMALLLKADLRECLFQHATCLAARFDGAWAQGADFGWADLRNSSFRGASLAESSFGAAELARADFRPQRLFTPAAVNRRVQAREGRLPRRRPERVDAVRFDNAKLSEAIMTNGRFPAASFVDADLRGVAIDDVYLHAADLRRAAFSGSGILFATGVPPASLTDTVLTSADLSFATLDGAKLQGASFRYSDVTGCDFTGADIGGADFTGARGLHPSMFLRATGTPVPPDCCGRRAPV